MNPQAIMSAIPWARRAWRLMPTTLRVPLLLTGAAAGIWYALEGWRELQQLKARDEAR